MSPLLARAAVLDLRSSQIRTVANEGLGRSDLDAFWFGESDEPTPQFIQDAGLEALRGGDLFYTHNLGALELRTALADYLGTLHGRPARLDTLAVTSSGVNALMIVSQALIEPGDDVVAVAPVWPNLVEIPRVLSARVRTTPLRFQNGAWRLDLDQLLADVRPGVKALFLNSPNNPTGWTLPAEDREAILLHCRRHGVWLIADDVYERLVLDGSHSAPSFLPLADPQDRLISVNSFSKTWRMTGWRLGWIVAPPSLTTSLAVLLEYNTSCAPAFVQAAGTAALRGGDAPVTRFRETLRQARDQVVSGLRTLPGVEVAEPAGGLYAFFRISGAPASSSLELAKDLVSSAGLGLAPGSAFGPEGEGWLRWCFAAQPAKNASGLERLERYLKTHRGRPGGLQQRGAGGVCASGSSSPRIVPAGG